MTDTLLEQIKADRENDKEKEKGWRAGPIIWDEDTGDAAYIICDRKHASVSVYNRIARVPDLEAAYIALTAERDALAAEVERLRGNLEDAASAVEWGARRMETQSYKVLMEKWASEYRAALEEGKDG